MAQLHTDRTHRLGSRAYFMFLGKGILLMLLLAAALFAWWWYAGPFIPKHYVAYYEYSVKLLSLLLGALFVFLVLKAWLEYRSHGYRFDDEFFHITRGYITQHEVGVVYHQIQTVTLNRTLGARFVGVATLTIVTSGNNTGVETHLPGIDARKARLVQRELLIRAKASQQGSQARGYQSVPFEDTEEEE